MKDWLNVKIVTFNSNLTLEIHRSAFSYADLNASEYCGSHSQQEVGFYFEFADFGSSLGLCGVRRRV